MNRHEQVDKNHTLLSKATAMLLLWGLIVPLSGNGQVTPEDVSFYYQISAEDIGGLVEKINEESENYITNLNRTISPPFGTDEQSIYTLGAFVSRLSTENYASLIDDYEKGMDPKDFETKVQGDLLNLFETYIESLSNAEFAEIYRRYLGKLAAEYLAKGTAQDFSEYAIQDMLDLTDENLASMYNDYIDFLWETLFPAITASRLVAFNEMLRMPEEEFQSTLRNYDRIADMYNSYVDTLIDSFHPDASDDEKAQLREQFTSLREYFFPPDPAAADDDGSPGGGDNGEEADTQQSPVAGTGDNSANEAEAEQPESSETTSGFEIEPIRQYIMANSDAEFTRFLQNYISNDEQDLIDLPPAVITDLLKEFVDSSMKSRESRPLDLKERNLLRVYIAKVADDFFVRAFRDSIEPGDRDFLRYLQTYRAANPQSLLEDLAGSEDECVAPQPGSDSDPGSMSLKDGLRTLANERCSALNASIGSMQDSWRLSAALATRVQEQVEQSLIMVQGIPYPSPRLLEVAVRYALNDMSGELVTERQFEIVVDAVMSLVSTFPDIDVAAQETSGDVEPDWNFKGCGCDINSDHVIYGFYPAWLLPNSDEQIIDFRYYDHVAYFGPTLDSNGEWTRQDEAWAEEGSMHDFIYNAHIRATRVDFAVYAPEWHTWDGIPDIVAQRIFEKVNVDLELDLLSSFATFITPVGPTYEEIVGKRTMGDGITLFFGDLVDGETGQLRDLETIKLLIRSLSGLIRERDPDDTIPINLMIDIELGQLAGLLQQLEAEILGLDDDPNRFIERLLIFLEQDTFTSAQSIQTSVEEVFQHRSTTVLEKVNPIVIPARDAQGQFTRLSDILVDLRWKFGRAGGAAIWPIPIEGRPGSAEIERTFATAMIDGPEVSSSFVTWLRVRYFPHRDAVIALITFLYFSSVSVLAYSLFNPITVPFLKFGSRVTLGLTFITMIGLGSGFDPYIADERLLWFWLPILLALAVFAIEWVLDEVSQRARHRN